MPQPTARCLTAGPRDVAVCLPNLFLAGFQHCGSTALYRLLARQPEVRPLLGHPEAHWLHTLLRLLRGRRGAPAARRFAAAYLRHAAAVDNPLAARFVLDGSRGYATEPPLAMPRLVRAVAGPSLRVLLIVREPSERLWSAMRRWCRDRKVEGDTCLRTFRTRLHAVVRLLQRGGDCGASARKGWGLDGALFDDALLAALWRHGLGQDFPQASPPCSFASQPEAVRGVAPGPFGNELDLPQMFASGLFGAHVLRWLRWVPPSALLLVRHGALRDSPRLLAACLAARLGLGGPGGPSDLGPRGPPWGPRGVAGLPSRTRAAVRRLYAKDVRLFSRLVERLRIPVC